MRLRKSERVSVFLHGIKRERERERERGLEKERERERKRERGIVFRYPFMRSFR